MKVQAAPKPDQRATVAGSNWHIETVDSDGLVGGYSSLALDGAGRPHISYYDYTNYNLEYAWRDGAIWQIETVDSDGEVGQYTSLALDELGRPHISYHKVLTGVGSLMWGGDLKYAWRNGTEWLIETVRHGYSHWLEASDPGLYTSLVLGGSGRPHILYCWSDFASHFWYDGVDYAWYDGLEWRFDRVSEWVWGSVGIRYWPSHTSLAMDGQDHPHISYVVNARLCDDNCNDELKYGWRNGVDWQIETVPVGSVDDVQAGALTLDELGRPHISFCDCANNDLKYAWRDGTDWQIETVDGSAASSSLVLDRSGHPHISYHDSANGNLKYAWHNGTTWQIETVDNVADVSGFAPLALDELDRPHISYYDYTNGDLKYARLMPSPFLEKQAMPSDGLRNSDTLTYTLTLSGPGLSVRL